MIVTMCAIEFKRLIENTKRFVNKSSGNAMIGYIYLEVNAGAKEITATACDGYKVSIEHAQVFEADESFKFFIKPNIPKITKRDRTVELTVADKKAYITVGENIVGYKQPEAQYVDINKVLNDVNQKEVKAAITVNVKLLKEALQGLCNIEDYKPWVRLEIRDKCSPILIIPTKRQEDIKLVLPINSER